jgi:phenylpropionate dioxygenase-like ring-hydroxylating dioxygenase large terminal subunit
MEAAMSIDTAWLASLVEEGRVRTAIYTEPQVFDAEMERIFARTWVYLAHESEIAEPGDYKTVTIATQPVIVVRDKEARIRVLFNRCRHRGASVCQHEAGNALYFRCAYHGWTYECDGRLLGMPYASRYDPAFDREAMGLAQVPRVGMHRGFIWASLAPDGPSLEEHLGPARAFIDEVVNVSPAGEVALTAGRQRYRYDGSWKFQMENGVDAYHPNFVHQSFAVAMKKLLADRLTADFSAAFNDASPAVARDLGNGHGALDMRCFAPFAADERNGGGFNLAVFPNLIVIGSQVRSIWPIAWNRTEVVVQPMVLKGLEHLTKERLRTHELFYGPAGFGQPDDAEIFRRLSDGLRATGIEWVDISRGLGRERPENGTLAGQVTDEVPQRGFYRMWKRLMTESVSATASGTHR